MDEAIKLYTICFNPAQVLSGMEEETTENTAEKGRRRPVTGRTMNADRKKKKLRKHVTFQVSSNASETYM